jgi:UDP-N-acetyl-D-mannosaminuronic acid dehydrogenase
MNRPIIGVIGLGYIGQPTVAALANVGYRVVGMDVNAEKVARLREGFATLYEPGLNETLQRTRHLTTFTTDYAELMQACDAVLVTVGTPIKDGAPDMSALDTVVTHISKHLRRGQTIVLRSTVTPGTTAGFARKLEDLTTMKCGRDFYVSFCPERTIEGLALYELYNLPKIIGGIDPESTQRTAEILGRMGGKVVKVSSATVAELCKLADNMYRALNIAFANEFGTICEAAHEDTYEVVAAVNATYNRTSIFRPGLGAGGPCLSKDPVILSHFAHRRGVRTPIVDSCVEGNIAATMRVADEAKKFIDEHAVKRPRVAMLGLSFKGMPETDDPRGAPVADIYDALVAHSSVHRADFSFFDPIIREFRDQPTAGSIEECIQGANVILCLTDHAMLQNLPLELIVSRAARPLLVVDAWHNLQRNGAPAKDGVKIVQIGAGR